MIVNLSQYDLVISYSWGTNPHGICGHTYEVIEYFHILQQHFNCCILLCEDITPETLEYAVREKYDFTEQELANLLSRTVYAHLPQLVRGKNILITDGGVVKLKNVTLLFDNIFMFACGNPSVKDNTKSNTYILQDNRVYEPVNVNGINYKKKILFSRLKKILPTPTNTNLLYLTTNCRLISQHMLDEIVEIGRAHV